MSELKEGDPVRFAEWARTGTKTANRKGVFIRYDRNGLAQVRWAGNNGLSTFHPSAIELDASVQPKEQK